MKLLQIKGAYKNLGLIELENKKTIEWKVLSEEIPPDLPFDSTIKLEIVCIPDEFLSGRDGIVWASYEKRQVEVIHNALLAQHINCEVKRLNSLKAEFLLLKITNAADINAAMDFIWRSVTGLRLIPDWSYPKGESNKSFEQWLNGQ